MGVVTVWEVECLKGHGCVQWCLLHIRSGAFLGEIPALARNSQMLLAGARWLIQYAAF